MNTLWGDDCSCFVKEESKAEKNQYFAQDRMSKQQWDCHCYTQKLGTADFLRDLVCPVEVIKLMPCTHWTLRTQLKRWELSVHHHPKANSCWWEITLHTEGGLTQGWLQVIGKEALERGWDGHEMQALQLLPEERPGPDFRLCLGLAVLCEPRMRLCISAC